MQDTNIFEEKNEFVPIMFRMLDIKILPKSTPVDVQGLYNIPTGIIKIGTHEEFTEMVLWHEQMHKLLFEAMDFSHGRDYTTGFKATIQFDNIVKDIEKFLFDIKKELPNKNYYGSTKRIKRDEL